MPVRFEEYEADAEESGWRITPGSNAHAIVSFLVDHPEMGFTPSEIREAVDLPRGSVGPTLHRLEERGLVRHKEPYWSIDEHGLDAYESMLTSMEAIESRYGDEGWADVDPGEYTVDESELAAWREGQ